MTHSEPSELPAVHLNLRPFEGGGDGPRQGFGVYTSTARAVGLDAPGLRRHEHLWTGFAHEISLPRAHRTAVLHFVKIIKAVEIVKIIKRFRHNRRRERYSPALCHMYGANRDRPIPQLQGRFVDRLHQADRLAKLRCMMVFMSASFSSK